MLAEDVMRREVHSVSPEDDVARAMKPMTQHRARHLPVVQQSKLLGVISLGDAVKAMESQAEELHQSNHDLTQFAYIASHDLQEPLRMVSSYLGLLQSRYEGRISEEADQFITFAVDGATRMKALINDLLGYSRLSNKPLKSKLVDADSVVNRVVGRLDQYFDETGETLVCDQLPRVRVDALQFEQIIANLVENALKYRSDSPPEIRVSARRTEDSWEFSVADNGIGIDPKHSDKIFQIFTRLHSRERYSGTGIGLASCRRAVERHGGKIWLEESESSSGSTFRFTLPVNQIETPYEHQSV